MGNALNDQVDLTDYGIPSNSCLGFKILAQKLKVRIKIQSIDKWDKPSYDKHFYHIAVCLNDDNVVDEQRKPIFEIKNGTRERKKLLIHFQAYGLEQSDFNTEILAKIIVKEKILMDGRIFTTIDIKKISRSVQNARHVIAFTLGPCEDGIPIRNSQKRIYIRFLDILDKTFFV